MTELLCAVAEACSWLLAGVFAVSAAGKLRSATALRAFGRSLRDMAVLPVRVVRPVAIAVAVLEAVTAVLLLVPASTVAGHVLAVGLLAAFTVAIALVLQRGTTASCRCFGVSAAAFGPRHLVRNGSLVAAALAGAAISAALGVAPWTGVTLLAAGAGVLAALLVVMLDELVALF